MSTYTELRNISLEFRRLSSNLLRSGRDDSDVYLARLMKYIEATPFIHDTIHNAIDNVDFNFKECFLIEGTEWWYGINIPEDEACHLRAQYDYMNFVLSEDKKSVSNEAVHYPHSSNHWSDIIQKFLDNAVKPMIDYINDAISTEMIVIEEEEKAAPSIVQNIGNNYGTLNSQGKGSIVSTNSTSIVINDINELLSKIIFAIDGITDVPDEDRESVKDDLESIQEQVNSPEPKKSRMRKALVGIKKFVEDFSMKLAVTLAVGAVTGADWNLLIQEIEQFLVR